MTAIPSCESRYQIEYGRQSWMHVVKNKKTSFWLPFCIKEEQKEAAMPEEHS
ncbi:MAG: hypothetical protein Q3M24_20915 [Candidatus Electrothrix aestuarii]|jgi:hypothetical protein|uniref:Uncharacterized protein n=1 Tax=Candidatus Electrothrix aestuarii TaxID=3062594 RepID=A0AAU8LU59_9BACT|nr:hypothetical protein [Candidatus Electrothrix aestuarii]WPD20797.1 MAG: hypothetical protein SD837_11370 [Candidatus Electrothrix sp. GW3-3]